MRAPRLRSLPLLAAGALLTGVLVLPTAAGAHVYPALLPDLRTLPPVDLGLDLDDPAFPGGTSLRLSNTVANHGRGPLELLPSPVSHNCDGDGNPDNDRLTFQRIFRDTDGNGVFSRSKDTDSKTRVAGCMRFHPEHNHWHFDNFARYVLRSQPEGDPIAHANKVSFCVIDGSHVYPQLPGSPKSALYPEGGSSCTQTTIEGLSVGWADTYGSALPGQSIDVTGLASGVYCLTSTADPAKRVRETNDSNNRAGERIRIDFDSQRVDVLKGPCKRTG